MTRKLLFILSAAVMLYTCGCQTVPYSGRSQLLLTSESGEEVAGIEAWNEIIETEVESRNAHYINAVNRVGLNIARAANKPEYNWIFKVFDSPEANAFCLPGGKIAVYTGLFRHITNDAELAAVIAHEVGHAVARHGGERMTQENIKDVFSNILSFTIDGVAGSWASTAFGITTEYGAILPFSRKHEFEADQIGLLLMTKAGYNPSAAFTFWQKFSTESTISPFGEFFSTHPMSEKRIENMKTYLPGALRIYKKAKKKHNYGQPL